MEFEIWVPHTCPTPLDQVYTRSVASALRFLPSNSDSLANEAELGGNRVVLSALSREKLSTRRQAASKMAVIGRNSWVESK